MKKKLLVLMLAALTLPATIKAQTPTLVLHHAKGNPTEIELYTLPNREVGRRLDHAQREADAGTCR